MQNRIIIMLAVVLLCSCSKDEQAVMDIPRTPVNFHARPSGAKSQFSGDEDGICSLNVWCYLDGTLDAEYFGPGEYCSLRLYENREYHIYALANWGKVQAPAGECEVEDLFIDFAEGLFPEGMPMSTPRAQVCTIGKSPFSVELRLKRLMARYKLRIRRLSDTVSEMELHSIRIGNAAGTVTPFFEGSCGQYTVGGDIDVPPSSTDGSIVSLYLPENMHGEYFDPECCSFVELKGTLKYADKPSDNCVYHLGQEMTFRWYLRDAQSGLYDVVRNTSYNAEFSWSDFGWIADTENISVDQVIEDQTYALTFCTQDGTPLSSYVFDHSDNGCYADVYFRIYPESAASQVSMSTNVPPARMMLRVVEEFIPLGNGIFRNRYVNTSDRASTSDMVLTLTNVEKGISCNATYSFKGSGSCIGDWERNEDENVGF